MTDEMKYGYCKRTRAWVPRDSMMGIGIRVYHPDGHEEHFTLRFAPEAHTDFVARLRSLEWDRVLKTKAELEALDAPLEDLQLPEMTDTAAWYRSRHGSDEDDVIVAKAGLRAQKFANNLHTQAKLLRSTAQTCTPQALLEALRAKTMPRWDHGVAQDVDPVAALQREYGQRLPDVVDALAVSADLDEILIVAIVQDGDDEGLLIETIDHGLSELAHRKAGLLSEGQDQSCY